jgi:hypothetical protein
MRASLKLQLQRARDWEAQEASLSASLQTEQTRWLELSARLDELERALATAKE